MVKKKNKTPVLKTAKIPIAQTKIPLILGFVGGILSVIFSILYLVAAIKLQQTFGMVFGIVGIISSGFIIYGTILLKTREKFNLGSLIIIVASIIALIPGVIIGPLIGLVGGILTRINKKV